MFIFLFNYFEITQALKWMVQMRIGIVARYKKSVKAKLNK